LLKTFGAAGNIFRAAPVFYGKKIVNIEQKFVQLMWLVAILALP
jgi:hypothetical protein